jgi:hypothetical protein
MTDYQPVDAFDTDYLADLTPNDVTRPPLGWLIAASTLGALADLGVADVRGQPRHRTQAPPQPSR